MTAGLTFEGDYSFYGEAISSYFAKVVDVMSVLAEMAELQRTGQPRSAEHVALINQAIRIEGGGSGDPWQTGWYKDLFFGEPGLDLDPTIADVPHGSGRGQTHRARCLRVARGHGHAPPDGRQRETCEGPRAYAGVVFAYHEHREPGLHRLNDSERLTKLQAAPAPDVPWLAPVLGAP